MKNISAILLILFVLPGFMAPVFGQEYKLPEYKSFKLDNGLTVYLMEQREVPLISVSAIVPAGAVNDGEHPGLANLTAEALKHGTTSYSKTQIDETLDFLGAGVNTYAGKEYAGVASSMAAKDLDQVMPIIAELLQKPVFNPEEFEKAKSRHLAGLERKKEQPRAVIGQYFDKQVFGDHPYGNISDGKVSSVSPLTTEDLKAFYEQHYHPGGAVLSIVGDFDAASLKSKVEELFGSWEPGPENTTEIGPIPELPSGNRVLLVNKDDARETTFHIGGKGISRNNPDYLGVMVINTLFGGRFTSMLNDELRVNSGLTYGARSEFETFKEGGSFAIQTFTATETTEAAIDKALEVLKKLREEGISENDLTSARNYVKGQFPPRYETSGQLAGLLCEMHWYGFNEDFINNFNSNVDTLDMAKAEAIIKNYFRTEDLIFVLIGKGADIESLAAKYGEVSKVEMESIIQ